MSRLKSFELEYELGDIEILHRDAFHGMGKTRGVSQVPAEARSPARQQLLEHCPRGRPATFTALGRFLRDQSPRAGLEPAT